MINRKAVKKRLRPSEIIELRLSASRGDTKVRLAEKFGISERAVVDIVFGKTRNEVPSIESCKLPDWQQNSWHEARDRSANVEQDVIRLFQEGKEQEEMVKILGLNSRKPVFRILKDKGLSCRGRNRAARDAAEPVVIRLFHEIRV